MSYLKRIGVASSQWLNVAVLNGKPVDRLASRAYKKAVYDAPQSSLWGFFMRAINWSMDDKDYCRKAYIDSISKAHEYLLETEGKH